ncbi:MAG TPA: transporter [Gammaproteobacteria bacterium]
MTTDGRTVCPVDTLYRRRVATRQPVCKRFARCGSSLTVCLFALCTLLANPLLARATEIEPRAFSNAPVGLNFLIAGYLYTDGSVSFDPAVPLTDAQLRTDSAVIGYARSLNAWGRSAKFDVIVPYTRLEGSALYVGQPRTREVEGFADPRVRVSINFLGAPALTAKQFAGYRQDLIIGASLQVMALLGQYDPERLVNIGTHRWAVKSELGISKARDAWTLEVAPGVIWYSDNTDFLNGGTVEQAPLYTLQAHLVRSFGKGMWAALDAIYYAGGRTTVNGVEGDTRQENTRLGATLALPIDRYNSVKLYVSTGTYSRTDSDFDAVGVAWQYRWGGGF